MTAAHRRSWNRTLAVLVVALFFPGATAIQFGAEADAVSTADRNPSNTLTITLNAAPAASDVLLAQIVVRGGSGTTITPPAGWTLASRANQGTTLAQAIYWKSAGATEPASFTFGFSASAHYGGAIVTYSGVHNSNPIDVLSAATSASNPATVPSLTTTAATEEIAIFCAASDGANSFAKAAGTKALTNSINSGGGASGVASRAYGYTQANAGATGPVDCDASNAASVIGHQVALRRATASASATKNSATTGTTSNKDPSGAVTIQLATATPRYDVMLAQVVADGGSGLTITPPAGWTLVSRVNEGVSLAQAIYWKAAGAGEPIAYAFVLSTPVQVAGSIVSYRGVDNFNPIDAFAAQASIADPTTVPSVTTTAANAFVVLFCGLAKGGTTLNVPAGLTARSSDVQTQGSGAGVTIRAYDYVKATAGPTGSKECSARNSASEIGHQIALRPVTVGFTSATQSGFESMTGPIIPVSLSSRSTLSTTVDYARVGGTATSGADYMMSNGTLTIPAGTLSANIPITVVNDDEIEPDETVSIRLTNPTNANLALGNLTYTILNDDVPPVVAFQSSASNGGEASTPALVTVLLSRVSTTPVTVAYSATDGTARNDFEFTLAPGTLSFAPGETTKTISVAIIDNIVYENDKTFTITLSNPTEATLGTPSTHTRTILEDDPSPTQELTVAANPVLFSGTPDRGAPWGGGTAEAGEKLVASRNYLKIVNTGTVPNPRVVVSFSDSSFKGAINPSYTIPLHNNVEFTWWEDTTPGSSAPSEETYTWVDSGTSATITFTGSGNIVYVAYRFKELPAVLSNEAYQASFTVTEL